MPSETMREIGKTAFDGLTANRRCCVLWGYTEAVMRFAFDLAVSRPAVRLFFLFSYYALN